MKQRIILIEKRKVGKGGRVVVIDNRDCKGLTTGIPGERRRRDEVL